MQNPGCWSNPINWLFDKTLTSGGAEIVAEINVRKNKFAHTCGEMSAGFINITIKDLHTEICLLYTSIYVFP